MIHDRCSVCVSYSQYLWMYCRARQRDSLYSNQLFYLKTTGTQLSNNCNVIRDWIKNRKQLIETSISKLISMKWIYIYVYNSIYRSEVLTKGDVYLDTLNTIDRYSEIFILQFTKSLLRIFKRRKEICCVFMQLSMVIYTVIEGMITLRYQLLIHYNCHYE